MLTALILGQASLIWKEERLVLPYAKLEALLYYLLLKKSATRSELAALLWSEMPEETAKKNLRNTVYMLRKILGDEMLLTPSRSLLLLNQKMCRPTDLESLGFPETGWAETEGGEFLAGFYCKDAPLFAEWQDEMRLRLREESVADLTRRGSALLKARR